MSNQISAEFNPQDFVRIAHSESMSDNDILNALMGEGLGLSDDQKESIWKILANVEQGQPENTQLAQDNPVASTPAQAELAIANSGTEPALTMPSVVEAATVSTPEPVLTTTVVATEATPAAQPIVVEAATAPASETAQPVDRADQDIVVSADARLSNEQRSGIVQGIKNKLSETVVRNSDSISAIAAAVIDSYDIPTPLKTLMKSNVNGLLQRWGISAEEAAVPGDEAATEQAPSSPTTELVPSPSLNADQFVDKVKGKLETGRAAGDLLDDELLGLPKNISDRVRSIFDKHIDIAKGEHKLRATDVEIGRWKIYEEKSDYLNLKMKLFKNNLLKTLGGSAVGLVLLLGAASLTSGAVPFTLPLTLGAMWGGGTIAYGGNWIKELIHPSKDYAKMNRLGLEIKKMNDELDVATDKNKLTAKEKYLKLINASVDLALIGRDNAFKTAVKGQLANSVLPDPAALDAARAQLNSAYK